MSESDWGGLIECNSAKQNPYEKFRLIVCADGNTSKIPRIIRRLPNLLVREGRS